MELTFSIHIFRRFRSKNDARKITNYAGFARKAVDPLIIKNKKLLCI